MRKILMIARASVFSTLTTTIQGQHGNGLQRAFQLNGVEKKAEALNLIERTAFAALESWLQLCDDVKRAIELFDNFEPESDFHPNRGKEWAVQVMNACKQDH